MNRPNGAIVQSVNMKHPISIGRSLLPRRRARRRPASRELDGLGLRRGGLLLPPHLAASALRPCRPWPWRLGTVALAARHDGLGLRIQARGGVHGLRWRRGPPPPSVARRGAAAAAGLLSRGGAGLQGGAGAAGLLERPAPSAAPPRGLRRRSLAWTAAPVCPPSLSHGGDAGRVLRGHGELWGRNAPSSAPSSLAGRWLGWRAGARAPHHVAAFRSFSTCSGFGAGKAIPARKPRSPLRVANRSRADEVGGFKCKIAAIVELRSDVSYSRIA